MISFNQVSRWSWAFLVALTLVLGLAGCEGDDGAPGVDGIDGTDGTDGTDGADGADGTSASVTPLESCGVCHSDGSFAAATDFHALDPIESVSNVTLTPTLAGDLVVNFSLAADGVLNEGYDAVERAYFTDGVNRIDLRDLVDGDAEPPETLESEGVATLSGGAGGDYTITIPAATFAAPEVTTTADADGRWLFRVAAGSDRETRVYFYQDIVPAAPVVGPPAVSAESCNACHGPEGIGVHGGYFAAVDGAEPCLVCHGVDAIPSLGAVAHGYHSGIAAWEDPPEEIEVTYPTYMNNCSVCHQTDDQLAAVNAMPVTGAGCFSCHGSIEGFGFAEGNLHEGLTAADDCGLCHGVLSNAPATVAATHNGSTTGRGGTIWNGIDTSIAEGALFEWTIDGVVVNSETETLAISWTASYDGNSVDPCNDTATAGNPVFFRGDNEEELSMYRSYAQGDDFIIGTSTSAPGQPGSVDLTFYDETDSPDGNTACQGLVATTTLPMDSVVAEKGRLALGGKPLVLSSLIEPATVIEARVPTPTYDWSLDDGEMVARRNVVDTSKCLGCHVGSLYQHGGDRVDNVDMCLVCHNAASNEKNRRVAMGVDASEAYDGKTGETFEMKTMLHRVHSAGVEGQPPYVVYRSRGIYAFAPDVSDVPNWDVISTEGCTETEISNGERLVFGGDPESSTSCQPHNFESPTYPRSLNECTACHTDDFMVIPDQTQSMATTTEAGSEEWANQLDDTLQGATTTACVTCHADGASKGHAYQNSWTPQVFPEGRQTIIDAVN